MLLGADELARYDDDGFLVIDKLIGTDTIDELRDAYDDILQRRVAADGDRMLGGITRQVMLPAAAHPTFARNQAIGEAKEIASQILGDCARTFDMLIYKPPGHPHETPWHQDMAYAGNPFAAAGLPIPLNTIQFWIPLDDVDVENGCMHFLPGLHRQPLLEHAVASGDPADDGRLLAITDVEEQLDLSAAVAAPLAAGGATMHAYGTPHYTPPNRSADRPRRAYIFNLASRRTVDALRRQSGGGDG